MRRTRIRLTCVFVFMASIVLLVEGHSFAHSQSGKISKKIVKEKKELNRIREEIERQRLRSRNTAKKENSILSSLEKIDRQQAFNKKELRVVNLQLMDRNHGIRDLDAELRILNRQVQSQKGGVQERVRALYQEGRLGALNVLMSSNDYYDFLKRYYYLSRVSAKERDLLQSYQTAVTEIELKQHALSLAREDLLEYKGTITRKLGEIKNEKRKKDRVLASIRNKRSTYDRAIRELESSTAKLKGLIQNLEKQRKTARKKQFSKGLGPQQGYLDWPTEGRVVSRFGRQKHPKFDTYVSRKGIEIKAGRGRPIRSVYEGSVVYADWLRGYGLLVIVDHGKNYYSLYAHAAKILVAVGDRVSHRQVIGEIGDTGLTNDNRLYFEIRRGSTALNPLKWLKKR